MSFQDAQDLWTVLPGTLCRANFRCRSATTSPLRTANVEEAFATLSLYPLQTFTANSANKLLRRTGQAFWQTESFDHWIRDDAEQARLIAYVHNNPVKAGFCRAPEEWGWSSCSGRLPSMP